MDATADDAVVVRDTVNTDLRSHSQRGYDRLASVYHRIEWLAYGRQLQTARTALIDQLAPWNRLLIFGDGDGRLLQQLILARFPVADRSVVGSDDSQRQESGEITSVEQSRNMIARQRGRVEASKSSVRVEFVQADALAYEPDRAAYDVIVTPFFLDCFSVEQLEYCLPQWLRGLRPGGVLYQVDFMIPERGWQRRRARLMLWAMHLFFRWQTRLENRQLVDIEPIIERHGLRKEAERIGGRGMIATQIWRA